MGGQQGPAGSVLRQITAQTNFLQLHYKTLALNRRTSAGSRRRNLSPTEAKLTNVRILEVIDISFNQSPNFNQLIPPVILATSCSQNLSQRWAN